MRQAEATPRKATPVSSETYTRRSEKVEARLSDPRGLCCTAAAIWYVNAIDALSSVACTRRRASNMINSLSGGNSLISLQMDLCS